MIIDIFYGGKSDHFELLFAARVEHKIKASMGQGLLVAPNESNYRLMQGSKLNSGNSDILTGCLPSVGQLIGF